MSCKDNGNVIFADVLEYTRDGEWGYENEKEKSTLSLVIRGTDFADVLLSKIEPLPRRYIENKKLDTKQLKIGDIIIETAGGTKNQLTGRTVILRKSLFEKTSLPIVCASFSRFLRVKKELCNPEYLYYYLKNLYTTGQMSIFNVQHTGVSRFQYTDFSKRTVLCLPSIAEQNAIASIMSQIDKKIEINSRTNTVLEAIGQAVFKRWFVDFEFPNQEGKPYRSSGGKMVSSELGEIPKDWSVGRFSDLVDLSTGKGLRRDRLNEQGKYPVLGANGELGRANEFLFDEELILTGRVGTLGQVYLVNGKVWISDNVLISKPLSKENHHYAFFILKSFDMDSLNRGSTQPLVTQTDLKNQMVILPDNRTLASFERLVGLLYNKVDRNTHQNSCLSKIRDLLLPKLMSGKIRVPVKYNGGQGNV